MRFVSAITAAAVVLAGFPATAQDAPAPTAATGPQDADERGLWMQVEDAERKLKASNFVIRDPALNDYVRSVYCKAVGPSECGGVRIYITRTPFFNASMAPNGMMQIWSGLFLRVRDEAQLAAVLAHEHAHYRQRHSLRLFRNIKDKTNAAAWLAIVPFAGIISLGMLGSIFSFSREMEREADSGSLTALSASGYDPEAASQIWGQMLAEFDATAAERKRKRRSEGGMFATHPPSVERQADLKKQAAALPAGGERRRGKDSYRAALAPYWADLIDDQIKLNDFGATDLLLGQLASDGWTAELLFARGELHRARGAAGDFDKAAGYYADAVARGAPVEAQRGLGMALLRSGKSAEGQAALKEYLRLRPEAKDKAMIAMLAGESS
jgi:predicted Zn-dependent protease